MVSCIVGILFFYDYFEILKLFFWLVDRYGYWGVCFIYGTFFALRALSSAGKTYDNNEAVRKGLKFLLSIQNEEGGWGESLLSCPTEVSLVDCCQITSI